jgi:hypothetical protein
VAVSDELSGGRLISIAWFLDFCLTGVTVSPDGMCRRFDMVMVVGGGTLIVGVDHANAGDWSINVNASRSF